MSVVWLCRVCLFPIRRYVPVGTLYSIPKRSSLLKRMFISLLKEPQVLFPNLAVSYTFNTTSRTGNVSYGSVGLPPTIWRFLVMYPNASGKGTCITPTVCIVKKKAKGNSLLLC